MNRRAFLATASAASLTACASTAAHGRNATFAASIDAAATRIMALSATVGLAVAIYTREGGYARGFGVTDVSGGERVNADTAFYIASSTKPLTALALTNLHHRGQLNLDATLASYAPDASFPANVSADETSLRQMLSHTSGIDNGPVGYRVAFSGQHDPETLWRLLAESAPNAEAPRGQFDYTNVGYNITTILTDRRLGVAWQDVLDREIFGPAGMRRASARMSRATNGGWAVAKPHALAPDGALQRIYLEKTDQTMHSGGGVIMAASDALRWLELMVEGGRVSGRQIIAPEAVATVQAPLAIVNSEFGGYQRESYGLGWYLGPHRHERLAHHFGGFAGSRAHVSFMPDRGVGVAVFVNCNAGALADTIANYAYDLTGGHTDAGQRFDAGLDAIAEQQARTIAASASGRASRASRPWTLTRPRAAYAGTYESEVWGRIDIRVEGERIDLRYGVLRTTAEPFTSPNSVRVEFVPGSGEPIIFQGDGERPSSLRTSQGIFQRI